MIVGIKLTHDAAVAAIEDEKLLFSIELEKIDNGPRYAKFSDLSVVGKILDERKISASDISSFVVDGWKNGEVVGDFGQINVAPYHEFDAKEEIFPALKNHASKEEHDFLNRSRFSSYAHGIGHVMAAYATSPFVGERVACVTWDGGQGCHLNYVNSKTQTVENFTSLFELYGSIYSVMAQYFGPYAGSEMSFDHAGKIMAYIANGEKDQALIAGITVAYFDAINSLNGIYSRREIMRRHGAQTLEHAFMRNIASLRGIKDHCDATILNCIHVFLERMLVKSVRAAVPKGMPLCFAGGSALNIKWNSALRDSGHFGDVWVPPFPNDSGSAIGAAACEMAATTGNWRLNWDVYSGPALTADEPLDACWQIMQTSEHAIALILTENPTTPIVALHGNAELGPRALGHRSILMSATLAENKAKLNAYKKREDFRPVAPICLEQYAPRVFSPGTPDPYMLYDHAVRTDWLRQVPAVVHIDGTARLQTIGKAQCPIIHGMLTEYHALTGVPLLCNTSANYNGKGFFPNVSSAAKWALEAGVKHIWSNGKLFWRN